MNALRWGLVVVVALGAGCDLRPALAQFGPFPELRQELVVECCRCLARRGTGARGASCTLAVLVEDEVVTPARPGQGETCATIGDCGDGLVCSDGFGFELSDDDNPGTCQEASGDTSSDFDDQVGIGEVPCLCDGDEGSCKAALQSSDGRITVPGSCIDQGSDEAPCEAACLNVLNFDPVQSG